MIYSAENSTRAFTRFQHRVKPIKILSLHNLNDSPTIKTLFSFPTATDLPTIPTTLFLIIWDGCLGIMNTSSSRNV